MTDSTRRKFAIAAWGGALVCLTAGTMMSLVCGPNISSPIEAALLLLAGVTLVTTYLLLGRSGFRWLALLLIPPAICLLADDLRRIF